MNDLGCDQVESCRDTCHHHREGLRAESEEGWLL